MKKQALTGFIPGKSKRKENRKLYVSYAGLTMPKRLNCSLTEALKTGILREKR
jgi:hypothetical protein